MEWETRCCGPQAWLVRFGRELSEDVMVRSLAVSRELEGRPPEGLREFTMGYGSVLLEFEGGASRARIGEIVESLRALPVAVAPGRRVEIPVVYDGPDLDDVACRTGLDVGEVVARHCGREYRVWLLGFAPGFPYLGVLDEVLRLPRRAIPRSRIGAGSVAIAGMQTGIYPSETSGGWHIIGRTDCRLFDPVAEDPFMLRSGDVVCFVAVEAGDV